MTPTTETAAARAADAARIVKAAEAAAWAFRAAATLADLAVNATDEDQAAAYNAALSAYRTAAAYAASQAARV